MAVEIKKDNSKLYGTQLGSQLAYIPSEIEANSFQCRSDFWFMRIPESKTKLGRYCFARCPELVSVCIPDSVKSVGSGSFYDCKKLEYVRLSKSQTIIAEKCFGGCKNLVVLDGLESIKEIEPYAFDGCDSLKEITISKGITIDETALPNNFKYIYVANDDKSVTLSADKKENIDAKQYDFTNENMSNLFNMVKESAPEIANVAKTENLDKTK